MDRRDGFSRWRADPPPEGGTPWRACGWAGNGPPAGQVRFTDSDVDQARAAGVLIEFERGRPIIVDRTLYRELVKGAIKRTHDELEAKAATAAKEKKTARASKQPADPVTLAKRERDAQLRELTDQAHGAKSLEGRHGEIIRT